MTRSKAGALAASRDGYGGRAFTAASAPAAPNDPIVIGWAFDGKGAMAPFDGPALAAAQIRVKEWNAKGGVEGRKLKIVTCDTQGNKPAIAKACAAKLLVAGRRRDVHDLRRRLRCTGGAGNDQRGHPHGRAVHRHRPDGPEALRRKGPARLLVRERRPGRGLGNGEYAWSKGWKTPASRPTP